MVLLTGAAGKTGRAIMKALAACNIETRALVRRNNQVSELKKTGATDVFIGDMVDADTYQRVMRGVRAVYHICPNMHPSEIEIGRLAINAAADYEVDHFVYHSVLHPQTEKMPHHWQKLRVEEMLFESGLDFTILQPAPYMQNILASMKIILKHGLYRVPYHLETRLSMLDLWDLGEVAATILTEPEHRGAVYEIAGTAGLTQADVVALIGDILGKKVVVEEITIENWRQEAQGLGMGPYQLETLAKMFDYYANYGLCGSSNVLSWLLGRKPTSLSSFIKREFVK
ncbi:MAG: SDR family oxidoreductase [Bacillota bacterium]